MKRIFQQCLLTPGRRGSWWGTPSGRTSIRRVVKVVVLQYAKWTRHRQFGNGSELKYAFELSSCWYILHIQEFLSENTDFDMNNIKLWLLWLNCDFHCYFQTRILEYFSNYLGRITTSALSQLIKALTVIDSAHLDKVLLLNALWARIHEKICP